MDLNSKIWLTLYSDNAGAPGTALGSSAKVLVDEFTQSIGGTPTDFVWGTPIALTSGTTYHLVFQYDYAVNSTKRAVLQYYNGTTLPTGWAFYSLTQANVKAAVVGSFSCEFNPSNSVYPYTVIRPSQWTPAVPLETYLSHPIGPLWVNNALKTWSLASPDDNLLRFETRVDEIFTSPDFSDDANTERNNVQELTERKHPISEKAKVSFDIMLDAGSANTAQWVVLGSLKGFYAADWSAPFEVALRGDKFCITANYEATAGTVTYRDIWTAPANLVRGQWYNFKISWFWGAVSGGTLQVLLDDAQIVNYAGKIGYTDQTAFLWKCGIYRANVPETLVVNIKNLTVTTGVGLPDW